MQAGNASFKRLLALPGARALLCALGGKNPRTPGVDSGPLAQRSRPQ